MARSFAYTLQEARDMLAVWKACERALATGQAKHYRVGTREFTALDLPEVEAQIQKYANMIEALNGSGRTTRTVRIVPRDL